MNCKFCKNYDSVNDVCKFCDFDFNNDFDYYKSDDWDILDLTDENKDWEHIQILDRLHLYNIDCYKADIWFNNNMAYLLGVKASPEKIAKILNIHRDAIYYDGESDFMILNLFQEKYLRGMIQKN